MVDRDLGNKPTLSEEDFQIQVKSLLSRKTKLIAWLVSDCDITRGAIHRIEKVKALEDSGEFCIFVLDLLCNFLYLAFLFFR